MPNNRIGLDTNVLARYYVASEDSDTTTRRQRELARKVVESGQPLYLAKTVLLELEWVLRGYYEFGRRDVSTVLTHLMSLSHLECENRDQVERAIDAHTTGLDFADALHHASCADCEQVFSFDDRGFARKSKRLNLSPPVVVPR